MSIQKDHLRELYKSLGVPFSGGRFVFDLGGKGTLFLEEHLLLEPSEKGFANLNDIIKREIGVEMELFDPKDERYQAEIRGNYERYFGRIWHHDEYDCCHFRKRTYYKYLKMTAPTEQVSSESWEKMAQFLVCVAGILSLVVVLGLVTAASSVSKLATAIGSSAASCLAALDGVSKDEQDAASITTPIER